MIIIERTTGKALAIGIKPVEKRDFKRLSRERYYFDWKEEQEEEVYQLYMEGTNDVLGLLSVERIPEEWRIHIRLLTVSKENKGVHKMYKHIVGNLLTFISKIALMEYGELACVSLVPKSNIAQHYMDKYGMNRTGFMLSLELQEILSLIEKYDHE